MHERACVGARAHEHHGPHASRSYALWVPNKAETVTLRVPHITSMVTYDASLFFRLGRSPPSNCCKGAVSGWLDGWKLGTI